MNNSTQAVDSGRKTSILVSVEFPGDDKDQLYPDRQITVCTDRPMDVQDLCMKIAQEVGAILVYQLGGKIQLSIKDQTEWRNRVLLAAENPVELKAKIGPNGFSVSKVVDDHDHPELLPAQKRPKTKLTFAKNRRLSNIKDYMMTYTKRDVKTGRVDVRGLFADDCLETVANLSEPPIPGRRGRRETANKRALFQEALRDILNNTEGSCFLHDVEAAIIDRLRNTSPSQTQTKNGTVTAIMPVTGFHERTKAYAVFQAAINHSGTLDQAQAFLSSGTCVGLVFAPPLDHVRVNVYLQYLQEYGALNQMARKIIDQAAANIQNGSLAMWFEPSTDALAHLPGSLVSILPHSPSFATFVQQNLGPLGDLEENRLQAQPRHKKVKVLYST